MDCRRPQRRPAYRDFPIRRTALRTSTVHPLSDGGISASLFTRENSSRTTLLSIGTPSETTAILPSSGIWLRRMLQPTHPARRAWELKGVRFSITLSEKNTLGISRRFCINHVLEY